MTPDYEYFYGFPEGKFRGVINIGPEFTKRYIFHPKDPALTHLLVMINDMLPDGDAKLEIVKYNIGGDIMDGTWYFRRKIVKKTTIIVTDGV